MSTLLQRQDMRAYEGFLFYWSRSETIPISYKYLCDILGIPQVRVLERSALTQSVRKLTFFVDVVAKLAAYSRDIDHGKHDLIWILLYCNTEKFASYLTVREELLGLVRENRNWLNSLVDAGKILSTQYSEQFSVPEFKLGSAVQNTSPQRKSFAEVLAARKLQF